MKRIVEIKIGNETYPLNFSIKAGKMVAEKYGSLEALFSDIEEGGTTVETFDKVIYLVELMMEQGHAYKEKLGEKSPKPLSAEDLELLLDFNQIGEVMSTISGGIIAGNTREVETEEVKDPNEKTTQTKKKK